MEQTSPTHTYNNGQPYRPARGRHHERQAIEHHTFHGHSIVKGKPSTDAFICAVKRELKIRAYSPNTISNYVSCITAFLGWFGAAPNLVTIEDVRNFLEMLVDGGIDSSTLSGYLSAIRTSFDKFCGRDVTLGLVTPRRKKSQPVILSTAEVARVISAAPNLTIKLAIGIMYGAGLRNKELCSLQVHDVDFERNTIRVQQGKGRSDRLVMLPQTFAAALGQLCNDSPGSRYLFPAHGQRQGRYMSPRTLQRWVKMCVELAGIKHSITPHSFRHAFATHLLENGTDIRFIQKLLGHQRLETTTIYTRVAQIKTQQIASPIDQSDFDQRSNSHVATPTPTPTAPPKPDSSPSVGRMAILLSLQADQKSADVELQIAGPQVTVLRGITVRQNDHNWIEISLPSADAWRPYLTRLPPEQQQRITNPAFFEFLRGQISQRFLGILQAAT